MILIGMIYRQSILHEGRLLPLPMDKDLPKDSLQGFFPGIIELLETVNDQIDIEQVVHAYKFPLNIVDLKKAWITHAVFPSTSGDAFFLQFFDHLDFPS